MQIPWYIGWPIVIAFGIGILFMVASRAPYYPIKYPGGFWELQSELGAEDAWLLTSDGVRLHAWFVSVQQASCTSEGLATVVRGSVDRAALAKIMKLKTDRKILLAQSVGYPKK